MFSVRAIVLLFTHFRVCNTPSSGMKNNSVYIQRIALKVRHTLSCVALYLGLTSVYRTLSWLRCVLKSTLKHSTSARCSWFIRLVAIIVHGWYNFKILKLVWEFYTLLLLMTIKFIPTSWSLSLLWVEEIGFEAVGWVKLAPGRIPWLALLSIAEGL
jgi:hypothetical protein